ncbi:hypothetical protein [Amycolatopsis rubida]|uniref:Uncharacterized protein n=1 Tax=Amycolatopsis rubida TaxID=112413 RepID=A0A1I5IHN3_9PSEU|nr:hypothetical protein [Amycolatopsis rubida]SFO59690.1 hypothetical protein SAMN05421854_102460 [Amycolatopsis rubida]
MPAEFVRARNDDTGAVAALPKPALEAGMCPGWAETAGPAPDKPKPAAFLRTTDESSTDTADDDSAGTEQSADAPSAKKKE